MSKLQQTLFEIISTHPKTIAHYSHVTGINVTAVAELIGVPQPTLRKILDGQTESLRVPTETIFMEFFNVSPNQLRGLEAFDPDSAKDSEVILDDEELEVVSFVNRKMRQLNDIQKKRVLNWLNERYPR